MTKAIANATTVAIINGQAAYEASSSDLRSIPASIPATNIIPFTIDVPIWLGLPALKPAKLSV